MYEVIRLFTDLQDNNHRYDVGDKFPRHGLKVTEERILELSTSNNKQGRALIKKVDDAPVEEEKAVEVGYTRTDINKMNVEELKSLAAEKGVENYEDKTGADLKKELIAILGL